MRHTYSAKVDSLIIRPLYEEDLELLRSWRNDANISRFFKKIDYIDSNAQLNWYNNYLIQKGCLFWAIVYNGKVVGSLSIYDINQNTAEIGRIMVGELSARGKGLGYKSLVSAMKIGFEFLGLETIYLSVHKMNVVALKIYERAGFKIVGEHPFNEEGCEYEMLLDKATCIKMNDIYTRIEALSTENTFNN